MTSTVPVYEPFRFARIESYRDPEARLWNHFHRCFPGVTDFKHWGEQVLAEVLSAPAGIRATLAVTNVMKPEDPPQQYRIEKDTTIGRGESCDIVLPEQVITKVHAQITRRGDQFFLEDLGSSLGTNRRNKKLDPQVPVELFEQDQFSIFPYNFRFNVEHVWAPETDLEIGSSLSMALSGERFEDSSKPGVQRFVMKVLPSGANFLIEVNRRLLEEIITGLAPSIGQSAEAAGLLESDIGLLEFFLMVLWERVNRDLQWDCRIAFAGRGRLPESDRRNRGIATTLSVRLRKETRTVRLFLPFDTVEAMQVRHRDPALRLDRALLAWRCPVTIGSVELTAGELRSIERFDVLLPDKGPAVWVPGSFRRHADHGESFQPEMSPETFRAGWSCSRDGSNFSRYRIDNYFETEQIVADPQSSAADAPQADRPTLDADQLPVQLHVIVGEKSMTLAELEQLAPGTVVQLDRGDEARVELAVNGKIVGHGELVQYEGALGVKVLGWRQR